MQAWKKPEKSGFVVLIKGFLGTDLYKCILYGDRLRFARAQAQVRMQLNCCRKGCRGWRKNDGSRCQRQISVPEKWIYGYKFVMVGFLREC